MLEVLVWYGVSVWLGLLAWPVCFAFFRFLPDRGYTLSRPIGLLLLSLLSWWLGGLGWLPFVNQNVQLLAIIGSIAVGLVVLLNTVPRQQMLDWLRTAPNFKLVAGAELIFLASYLFVVNARSFIPALNADEKFFDLAFLQSLATSPQLPPPDPWFGGQPMHYYYGGQLLVAVMCRLTATPATTGYNIGLGLFYAYFALACFGFAINLVRLTTSSKRGWWEGGILGWLMVAVAGNLMPLRQLLRGELLPFGNPDFPLKVDWRGSARMIWDFLPDQHWSQVLTESPVYSFLMGDLHAHMLALPFVLAVLSLGLQIWGTGVDEAWVRWRLSDAPKLLMAGTLVGSLAFINGFDFPVYVFLLTLVIVLNESRKRRAVGRLKGWAEVAGRGLLQLGGVLLGVIAVYLLYFQNLLNVPKSPNASVTLGYGPLPEFVRRYAGLVTWKHTYLSEYLTMFGLFLLPILTFYSLKIVEMVRNAPRQAALPISPQLQRGLNLLGVGVLGLALSGGTALQPHTFKSALILLPGLIFGLGLFWPRVWLRIGLKLWPALELVGLITLTGVGVLLDFELLGPLVALIYFSFRLLLYEVRKVEAAGRPKEALVLPFVLLGIGLASGLVLFCEIFYSVDMFNARGFLVWKLWYQAWLLYGFGAAFLTYRMLSHVKFRLKSVSLSPSQSLQSTATPQVLPSPAPPFKPSKRWPWLMWVIGLVGLILIGLATPGLAYWQQANHYTNRVGLDGELWYAQTLPAEYKAMRWLRDYTTTDTARRGIVLEANGMNYTWASRISTYTGLPTVVGWPYHELHWRGYLDPQQIWQAWLDMDRIYATTDPNEALTLLKRHNVRYVFVGQVENGSITIGQTPKKFSAQALAKFSSFLRPLYQDQANNIAIYSIDQN